MRSGQDDRLRTVLIALLAALLAAWIIIISLDRRGLDGPPRKAESEKGMIRFYDESPLRGREGSGPF